MESLFSDGNSVYSSEALFEILGTEKMCLIYTGTPMKIKEILADVIILSPISSVCGSWRYVDMWNIWELWIHVDMWLSYIYSPSPRLLISTQSTHTHTGTPTHPHTHTHVYTHTRTHTGLLLVNLAHTYTHTHSHTHLHTHTLTHSQYPCVIRVYMYLNTYMDIVDTCKHVKHIGNVCVCERVCVWVSKCIWVRIWICGHM